MLFISNGPNGRKGNKAGTLLTGFIYYVCNNRWAVSRLFCKSTIWVLPCAVGLFPNASLLAMSYELIYWFPNPFWSPQSGHCQVMALQDIPQMFSCIHAWQIWKPHRHRQQKRNSRLQQWQVKLVNFRCFRLGRGFAAVSFIVVV